MAVRVEEEAGRKIVYIEGEINTSTSGILQEALDNNVNPDDDLIMDFAGVPYLSSAGLRILMVRQKEMAKEGSLTLRNVNDLIFDIFKTVKLDQILTIEGRGGDTVMEKSAEDIELQEYELADEDADRLPPRIYHLYSRKKLMAFSIDRGGDSVGFTVCLPARSGVAAYILYVYVNEEQEEKDYVGVISDKLLNILEDQDITELYAVKLAGTDSGIGAEALGFTEPAKTEYVLSYSRSQILDSPIWKRIDKLREMCDKIKCVGELEPGERQQFDLLYTDEDLEDTDRDYAGIYCSEGKVEGMLNALKIAEDDIWVSKVTLLPSKEANRVPVILMGSLLDKVMPELGDGGMIHIVIPNENMVEPFKQVLGQPGEVSQDVFCKKTDNV